MATAEQLLAGYGPRLDELCRSLGVPGAVVGVRLDGQTARIASGTSNLRTASPTSPGTLFQIGSISKVYTATALLRLVERGQLDLDVPVRTYLPGLRLADTDATEALTLRHLLTHTSGISGDVFDDTGRGDDCLDRYVGLLADVPQVHPLGAMFSYCNSGYVLAGRLLEVATGLVWDQALAAELLEPLDLRDTVTLPEEALLRSTAVCHGVAADGTPYPSSQWTYPRALGPAGLICATVDDLLAFGSMHLAEGRADSGARILAADTERSMRGWQVDVPGRWPGDSWGLGWIRYQWGDLSAVGHDGGTIGQRASLRLVPERGLVIATMANSANGAALNRRVLHELLAGADVDVPELPVAAEEPPAAEVLGRHVGSYGRLTESWEVALRDGALVARQQISGSLQQYAPVADGEVDLRPVDDHRYVATRGGRAEGIVTFGGADRDRSAWLFNGRVSPRLSVRA